MDQSSRAFLSASLAVNHSAVGRARSANNKPTNEKNSMNNKFDELTKQMAQSVTRRAALKKFGVGLAGLALACFGLANRARATTYRGYCEVAATNFEGTAWVFTGYCLDVDRCHDSGSADCPAYQDAGFKKKDLKTVKGACGHAYKTDKPCSFTV